MKNFLIILIVLSLSFIIITFSMDVVNVYAYQEKALYLYYSWKTHDLQKWMTDPTLKVSLDVWLSRLSSLISITIGLISISSLLLHKKVK